MTGSDGEAYGIADLRAELLAGFDCQQGGTCTHRYQRRVAQMLEAVYRRSNLPVFRCGDRCILGAKAECDRTRCVIQARALSNGV